MESSLDDNHEYALLGKVPFLLGGGVGRGMLETFCEKSRGPPTSENGLKHDPSQIPTQKHLTLPPPPPWKTRITGSVTHITASAHKAVNCVACDCTVKT